MREVLDRLDHHDHHNGGAVGIGDDSAGTHEGVGGVALGHHERDVGIHTESAGIVDHHGSVFGDGLGKLLGGAGAGGSEGDVYALEIVIVLEKLDGKVLALELVGGSRTAGRAEKGELVDGKIALLEHFEEFLADSAAGADYGHII